MDGAKAIFRLSLAATAFLAPTHALHAQDGGAAVIYANGNFKGRGMTLTGPLQGLEQAFTAKSIRIPPGQSWEFCSGRTFTGCRRVDSSVKAGVFTVRSARPIAPVVRSVPGSPTAPGAPMPNATLRGLTSEYFVAPQQGNQRIGIAKNNPEDMRRSATEFCRRAGWRFAIHSQLQEVGGTYYLIDVLCSNFSN